MFAYGLKGCGFEYRCCHLTFQRLKGGRSKNAFFRDRVRLCFFVPFNIIIRHIFPEKFYLISSGRSEDMNVFFFNINDFHQFFVVFFNFLVTKKLMMSAYNRLRQHFFTTNLLKVIFLTIL